MADVPPKVLFLALLLTLSGVADAQDPAPWSRLVFESGFELGELEDAERERIPILRSARFLESWEQQTAVPDLPHFMEGSLVRPGAPDGGLRHLELPVDGGRALLISRAANERDLLMEPGTWLHVRAKARWDDLGQGAWRLELFRGDDSLTLLEGRGEQPAWNELESARVVPESLRRARLRLTLDSPAGQVGGKFGIDDIELRVGPRIIWEFQDSLRRVDPQEGRPLKLRSVGLPPGTYDLELSVRDRTGREVFRMARTRLVGAAFPIEDAPRLWELDHSPPRGIYTVELSLRNQADDRTLRDSRRLILAPPASFPRLPGERRWGVVVDASSGTPVWLPLVRPHRALVRLRPGVRDLPTWLDDHPETERGVILDPRLWPDGVGPDLSPFLTEIRRVYWHSRGDDGAARDVLLGPLATEAPFLRLGTIGAWRGGAAGGSVLFELPADTSARARELGVSLCLAAAAGPTSFYVADPDDVFVLEGPEGLEPRRTLLVWEFLTGFLSGATYRGRESFHPDVNALSFERRDEEFIIVFADSPRELILEGGAATGYTSEGNAIQIRSDATGRCIIPVGVEPMIVRGLDLERIRTFRSVASEVTRAGGVRGGQRIVVSVHNHFREPVRAALRLDLPPRWEVLTPHVPHRIEPGTTGQLALHVRVPPSSGIDDAAVVEGTLELEGSTGRRTRGPVAIDVPRHSPFIAVESLGIGFEDAEVRIRNTSNQRLTVRVNLYVSVTGNELTRYHEVLEPGAAETYRIRFAAADTPRKLWVGVAIDSPEAYVNRNYAVPPKTR